MNTFKCDSCGSRKYITKQNKDFCQYCDANFIKKTEIRKQDNNIPLVLLAILLVVFSITYYFTQKNTEHSTPIVKKRVEVLQSKITTTNEQTLFLQNFQHKDEEYIKNLFPSVKDLAQKNIREKNFSPWLSKKEFQELFDTGYFKKRRSYPIYTELDANGNRRNIEIPYEPKFYWSVKTGRLLQNFQRHHVNYLMNGKKLLNMSVTVKGGVKLYSGVWVSKHVFQREAKKLAQYGIYPPTTVFQKQKITFQKPYMPTLTQVSVTLITANVGTAATRNRVSLIINNDSTMKFPLDLPQYDDHALGSKDNYQFSIDYPIKAIKSVKLSIEGFDAWKVEQFSLKLREGDKYSAHYLVNANQWMSQETHDINKLGAKPSLTFNLNNKTYSKENIPTVYLPIVD